MPTLEIRATSFASSGAPPAARPNRMLAPLLLGLLLLVAGGALALWLHDRSNHATQPATAIASPASSPAAAGSPQPPAVTKLWEVIPDETRDATNVESILAEPDGQMSIIMPGGQLALTYLAGQFFGDGEGADLRVYGHERDRGAYSIFVRDDPNGAWRLVDVNRHGFPQGVAGHDIIRHGVRRVRQVMIKNIGGGELHIDAVAVVYKDTISSTEDHHHGR